MAQQFYVRINNVVHGPLTGQKLQEMAQSGQISPTDEVRPATSMTNVWLKAETFKGLQFATAHEDTGIPDPPDYSAVSFFIGLYNLLGFLTIFVGVIRCSVILNSKNDGDDRFFIPLLIVTFFTAAFCFFGAQLLALARNSARNLHYLTHFNRRIMESIVNNKK